MTIHTLNARLRSSVAWRAVGVAVCLWVSGVIGLAGWAAHSDGLKLYHWTMLGFLLIGPPLAIGALLYAASLLGQKVRKAALLFAILAGVTIALLQGYREYQSRVRAVEHRVAQIAENAAMAKRIAAKEMQDRIDWHQYGAACSIACVRRGNFSKFCAAQCSQHRGEQIRKVQWKADNASCATQCATDPNKYCDMICEMKYERAIP